MLLQQRFVVEAGYGAVAIKDRDVHASLEHQLAERYAEAVENVQDDAGKALVHPRQKRCRK
jgi:hypothetical protein